MRMVVFSSHDMEAMTVIEVPQSIIDMHRGETRWFLRMMPRMRIEHVHHFYDFGTMPDLRIVTLRVERMLYAKYCGDRPMETLIALADDDGLSLNAALLPGQRYLVEYDYA